MASISSRHPLSVVFLLHIALDAPFAVQGAWAPQMLPFLEMNNTTLVLTKLYASLCAGMCLASLLCFGLPEYLPGKRAFAIGLVIYHSICSTVLLQAPRVIPHSFGAFAESYRCTPEVVWGCMHGILSVWLAFWWQATLPYTQAAKGKIM